MLAEVRPDFTDIATTVASLRPLVELAERHSCAVICQKPFAETMADGEAMVAACDRAGIPLLVHENFSWQAPYRALGAALSSGVIGAPTFLRLSFRHAFDIYANQPYLAATADLALTNVGLHLFDMARLLLGDVRRVHCETQRLNRLPRLRRASNPRAPSSRFRARRPNWRRGWRGSRIRGQSRGHPCRVPGGLTRRIAALG